MHRFFLLLLIIVCSLVGVIAPAAPVFAQDSLTNMMTLSCRGLSVTQGLCGQLQGQLRPTSRDESMDKRIARARSWLGRAVVRQRGAALSSTLGRRKGSRSAAAEADLGMAHLLAGNFGEAMHHLTTAHQQKPQLAVAVDGAFVGYMLIGAELEEFQQADWAGDLAGRIGQDWPTNVETPVAAAHRPRAVDVTRVAYLYWLAGKWPAAMHFATLGLHWYPNNRDLEGFAQFLRENKPQPTKTKPSKPRRKGRYSR